MVDGTVKNKAVWTKTVCGPGRCRPRQLWTREGWAKTVCGSGRCRPGWYRSVKCGPEQRVWTRAMWTRDIGVRAVGMVRAKAVEPR